MVDTDYKACAEYLFMLLDDIGAVNVHAGSNDETFREAVNGLHIYRFDIANTDGHSITFK